MTLTLEPNLRGSTDRIRFLRQESEKGYTPTISMERAQLVTEAYQKYEGVCQKNTLRGKTFNYLMTNRTLFINKRSLIVGEKGHQPWAAPTFPELACHSLKDFYTMNARDKVFFKVSKDDCRIQEEKIIPYWSQRSMLSQITSVLPEKWHDLYEAGLYTEPLLQFGLGQTVGDEKIYQRGYKDCIHDIDLQLSKLNYTDDLEALTKRDALAGMKLACEGMVTMGERYAELARELAEEEEELTAKEELLQIAEVCDVVPAYRPKTFRQAIQMYWFTHIGVTLETNNWDSFSPGKLDHYLEPFYNKELAEGTLTREEAKELIENLWIQFNNQPAPPTINISLVGTGTYTNFSNINTGSLRANGSSGVSDLSYLILEVTDDLKLLQPSSNIQVSRKTPEHFLRESVKVARKGWGQPAFLNSDALVQELLGMGVSLDDARANGVATGCVETGLAGKEAYMLTGHLNLPKVLELVLNNGIDSKTNRQVGLDLGSPQTFRSYQQLYDAFCKQLQYVANVKLSGTNIIERMHMTQLPVPLMSVLTDDCIARAKDYNNGGARYNSTSIPCVGISTLVDSLAVIKKHVFEEKRLTLDELLIASHDNFDGYDDILKIVRHHTPKYGNDDDYADDILYQVNDSIQEALANRQTVKGATTNVSYIPMANHIQFGQSMEASVNGRLANTPLPDGISPEKGADRLGPTAVIKSAAKLDHLKTGGTLLNQKFSPAVVAGEAGLSHMVTLIRSYFAMDGHHIQFNVLDKETLIKAQQRPEEYENLIIRVAGYSDYFNNLEKALQDEIINRTEQGFRPADVETSQNAPLPSIWSL